MEQATERLTECYIQRRSYFSAYAREISHTYIQVIRLNCLHCVSTRKHIVQKFQEKWFFLWFDGNVFVCASYNVIIMFSPFRVTHVPFIAGRTTCLAIEIVAHTITQHYDTHGNQMINLRLFYVSVPMDAVRALKIMKNATHAKFYFAESREPFRYFSWYSIRWLLFLRQPKHKALFLKGIYRLICQYIRLGARDVH